MKISAGRRRAFHDHVHARALLIDFLTSHALMLTGWATRARAALATFEDDPRSRDESALEVIRTALTRLSQAAAASGGVPPAFQLDHRWVTHSRNWKDTEGHRRIRRPAKLSTRGDERKREDTRGHDIRPVRDREAPGSNPGPPTNL